MLYLETSPLLYLHVSNSFLGLQSSGLSSLTTVLRGVLAPWAPWVIRFLDFNFKALINVLGRSRAHFLLGSDLPSNIPPSSLTLPH